MFGPQLSGSFALPKSRNVFNGSLMRNTISDLLCRNVPSSLRCFRVKRCFAWSLLVGSLLISGCGDGNPPAQPTRGQLFINGVAASGATVAFHPVGGDFDQRGTCPSGRVAEDGSFSLSTYGSKDGVPAGEYAVTVVWPLQPSNPESPDRLNRRLCSPANSPLRVTITEGENELEPFRLDKIPMFGGGKRR